MLWKPRIAPPPVTHVKPAARVYEEHVKILRELKADERLIEIAERVAAEHSATRE